MLNTIHLKKQFMEQIVTLPTIIKQLNCIRR